MFPRSYTDIHVLNVGAGSCAVIESPSGRISMIDINDGGELRDYEKSAIGTGLIGYTTARQLQGHLVDPIQWVQEHLGTDIWRFILSHPDADHMAGIRRILRDGELILSNFWDLPHHRRRGRGYTFRTKSEQEDWQIYESFRARGNSSTKVIRPLADDTGQYWTDDQIQILGPAPELVDEADERDDYNDASYVLRVRHATSSVLIPGDVEEPGWEDILDRGRSLRANVLVASHHGRKSGYSQRAMNSIRPEVVIASTAKLLPKDDGLPLYRKHTSDVFSTREHGTLTIRMFDDGDLQILDSNGRSLASFSDAA
jgi:competence protein ComEC